MACTSFQPKEIEPAMSLEEQTFGQLISPKLKEVSQEQQLITTIAVKANSKSNGCCSRYSTRQWTIFLASSKGVPASVYGMVFGVFELVNCIACLLRKLGVKTMLNYDRVPAGAPFIALAFIIRIVEALGQSAYLTAAYATVAREFPENIATTFSLLETVFAVGMIMGPAAGGFMYEIGGYVTPFAVTGNDPKSRPISLLKLLSIPAIAIYYYSVTAVAFSLGFTHALLQPHLEQQFNTSTSTTGLIFMVSGGTYALSSYPWGILAEKGVDPKLICTTGGIILAGSFIFIGPAPFFPIKQELWLLVLSLVLHGVGSGAEYVSAFLDSSKEALSHGFPDNIETYGLVSGLWISGLSLGSFLGPTLSGCIKFCIISIFFKAISSSYDNMCCWGRFNNKIEPDVRTEEQSLVKLVIPQLNHVSQKQQLNTTNETVKEKSKSTGCCSRYSPRQWSIFLIFCGINVCAGSVYSLQAPFFPKLASSKGVSASVYGMVFGIFELVNFIACILRKLGVKPMLNYGNMVMAICCIAFGFLDKVPAGAPFIALAFIIRIVEALGQSAYLTAAYATIAREFPESIATTFSVLETIFAVGMIMGPAAGGFMYEIGGYVTPFAVTGSLLLLASGITSFFFPKIGDPKSRPISLLKLLSIPSVAVCYYSVIAISFSFGFLLTLLQPHLEQQFNISSSMIGLIFMIHGVSYALSAIPWAILADKGENTKLINTAGGIILAISFTFIGPAPFLHLKQELWLLILSLVLHGVAVGAEFVSAFLDIRKEVLFHGFPDNIKTYGLLSSLWISGLSLGSFLGPILSGVFYDAIGFQYTAIIIVGMHIMVAVLSFASYQYSRHRNIKKDLEDSDYHTRQINLCRIIIVTDRLHETFIYF
uniref:Major facilitator superfamily (MFS) profile domain-containing protein n=1 Tax=Strigamia maritima TaxID=126957 RepID=T1J6T3_STRMM